MGGCISTCWKKSIPNDDEELGVPRTSSKEIEQDAEVNVEPSVQRLDSALTRDDISLHEGTRPNEKNERNNLELSPIEESEKEQNGNRRKKAKLSFNRKVMTVKPRKNIDSQLGGGVTTDERERRIEDYQAQLNKKNDEIKNLLETVQTLTNEQDSYQLAQTAGWRQNDTEIRELRARLREKEEENEILLIRLSSVVGAKLTNNNPNIADLSDVHRPTKLSEKFSELYDNEWTDAFLALETKVKELNLEGINNIEKEIIHGLLKMVTITYETCLAQAETDIERLKAAHFDMIGGQLSAETEKQLHTERRKNHQAGITKMQPVVTEKIRNFVTNSWKLKEIPDLYDIVQIYLDKCLELCWLMAIQDPPVYMDCDIKVSKKNIKRFDKNLYKPYTKQGKKIAYVVWPVLFLYKGGGPVLNKGVAQGKGNQTIKEDRSIYKKGALTSSQNSESIQKITTNVFSGTLVKQQSAENNVNTIENSVDTQSNISAKTRNFMSRREAFVDRDTEETTVFSDTCTPNTGTNEQRTRKRKKMSSNKGSKDNQVKAEGHGNKVENVSIQPDIEGRGSHSTPSENNNVGIGYDNNARVHEEQMLSENRSMSSLELPEVPNSEEDSYHRL